MLRLGAIRSCTDLSGKSTQQPNTAIFPCIYMVFIHMDCRCLQKRNSWGQYQWVYNHVHSTQGITALPWGSLRTAFWPLALSRLDVERLVFPDSSPHFIWYWLVFTGWEKCFLFLEQRKEGRGNNSFVHPNFWDGFSAFLKWVWLPFTANDFF